MKIGVVSLGCDKNRVDTEKMLARLIAAGYSIGRTEEESDVIIINTCAFIDSAKKESIEEIFNALSYKDKGKKVIVTGCLSQRYLKDLEKDIPEVDAFLGVADYDKIVSVVEKITAGEKCSYVCGKDSYLGKRMLTTPSHYAYLKIADGCDNFCSYCAIPYIRGRYKSEDMDNLIKEASSLADDGVKELILVAQDVTNYGKDLSKDKKPQIVELLDKLCKLDFDRIRLLYLEPDAFTDELIQKIKTEKKICKYVDIPFQHAGNGILKKMNRHYTNEQMYALVNKLRSAGITIRSTFILGFPGETDKDVEELIKFLKETKLDCVGFFGYSREEGTPAAKMEQCSAQDIKARLKAVKAVQNAIIKEKSKAMVGQVIPVMADGIDYETQSFIGRSENQAPDIDGIVYFASDEVVEEGNIYNVEITSFKGADLFGRVVK